jgi:hypothetical protein
MLIDLAMQELKTKAKTKAITKESSRITTAPEVWGWAS